MNLAVEVISDVICPWCYIGKRRLEKAIAAHDKPVSVRWHPFQLNLTIPREGISRREYRTRKFGSWERSLELDSKVMAVGESEGILFDFEKTERTPNTVDARWRAMSNLGSSVLIASTLGRRLDRSASHPAARSPVIQGFLNEQVSVVSPTN